MPDDPRCGVPSRRDLVFVITCPTQSSIGPPRATRVSRSAGKGAGSKPILPDEAKLAVVREPERPKPIDLRIEGIGQ